MCHKPRESLLGWGVPFITPPAQHAVKAELGKFHYDGNWVIGGGGEMQLSPPLTPLPLTIVILSQSFDSNPLGVSFRMLGGNGVREARGWGIENQPAENIFLPA